SGVPRRRGGVRRRVGADGAGPTARHDRSDREREAGGLAPEREHGGRVVRGAARAGRGQGGGGSGSGGGAHACGGGASTLGSYAGRPTLGAEPAGAATARRAGAARGVG